MVAKLMMSRCNNSTFPVNLLARPSTNVWLYIYSDALGLFNDLLDKEDFAHILKHQIDAMCNTWSPKHCGVLLH